MILHVDMDAFYAAVEQLDQPALRGKPVVVGGSSSGRGVVMAASYEARRYGIHSAMPGRRALELCPTAVFVKGRMSRYAEVGRQIREIFHRFTPLVQPLSLDEAFLDVSGSERLFGSGAAIGRTIKRTIRAEVGLTASVGVAPLKFVAKIASDLHKPDGFVEVPADRVQAFLDPLPVEKLWGVGRKGSTRLRRLGIRRIGDLRAFRVADLTTGLGSWGEHLWRLAHGLDPRAVVPDRIAKQISHERTFHHDVDDEATLRAVVSHLCEQTARRLRRSSRTARTVTIKYRREDFRTFARSRTLRHPTASTTRIFACASELLVEMRKIEPRPVRLIGVGVGSLSDNRQPRQQYLFDVEGESSCQDRLDKAMDALTDTLGDAAVYRAASHAWIHRTQ